MNNETMTIKKLNEDKFYNEIYQLCNFKYFEELQNDLLKYAKDLRTNDYMNYLYFISTFSNNTLDNLDYYALPNSYDILLCHKEVSGYDELIIKYAIVKNYYNDIEN